LCPGQSAILTIEIEIPPAAAGEKDL
jgi:hypothetical protein